MADRNPIPLDKLPMPEPKGPETTITLDAWEFGILRRKASADCLTYLSHYGAGTAGKFSDDEIATMQRYRRLCDKLTATKEVVS